MALVDPFSRGGEDFCSVRSLGWITSRCMSDSSGIDSFGCDLFGMERVKKETVRAKRFRKQALPVTKGAYGRFWCSGSGDCSE